ncbi:MULTISPECIES: hypothetical protein [unclassified Moorena]|uniref:hypothetical protein n=1 Tax=unclassified Moorena TaxID=2683338 RepID=UPI0013CD7E62|nr:MULTISPECIES: hypothetical protein [unclassified Moorena]NEO18118.1 hypothetical protein [Moorena sp. SIO4A5]NEQ57546.1 hypothetical protein [Moorena sp. SIO4A1]
MPVPQDLQNYLTEIQDFLESQKNRLEEKYKKKKGKSPTKDTFKELTQAINCVNNLKEIQNQIYKYLNDLES